MTGRPCATKAGYVSLTTFGAGRSSPILFGSNPVGDALLSSGLMTLAGVNAAAVVPLLPVRMSGIDLCETLHRLDAAAQAPTWERGVTSANRIGEPLGVLTMRWLVAPDGFDATASGSPPHTELDASRSQRFVMQDGAMRFDDRTRSGLRFFGAGRTYPSSVDGTRLLFAAAAVVVEGLGSLKRLRGTLAIAGEISARSLVSLIVTGRFDADGPLEATECLGPLIDCVGDGPDATVLTLAGESDGCGANGEVVERIRVARIENDLANATRPRSVCRPGEWVGRATGPLRFDSSDRRCAVRLIDGRRELTFSDSEGQPVGSIVADALEGTAFRDEHLGPQGSRVIAYAQLSAGTGVLAGAGGVLTMDTALSREGAASSVYTLWLIDRGGRFRARGARGVASMPTPDLAILAKVDRTLAEGTEIHRWFRQRERTADYGERFDVGQEGSASHESFGFFDVAPIGGQAPVMGIVQEMFYDRQAGGSPETTREQLREFVFRYFLPGSRRVTGTRYEQQYYKLARTGHIGEFAKDARAAVVDLREIGTKYDWILLKEDVTELPQLPAPSREPACLVTGPAFITNADNPEPGVLAEYGFGYAFVPYARDEHPALAGGPGSFRVGIQTVNFKLLAGGDIRVRSVFIVNRSDRTAAPDVDPSGWNAQLNGLVTFWTASWLSPMLTLADRLRLRANGFDPVAAYMRMANAMTGGLAATHFGLSTATLEKRMLRLRFTQHRQMLDRSRQLWRVGPDWTAHETLPESGQRGVAC